MKTMPDRNTKYGYRKKSLNRSSDKWDNDDTVKLNLDAPLLRMFAQYTLSENTTIHRSSLVMMKDLLNEINEKVFEGRPDCSALFHFCKDVLKAKLDNNVYKKDIVLREVTGITKDEYENVDINSISEINNDEVEWIEKTISTCANILFINDKVSDLGTLCSAYNKSDFSEKENYAKKIKDQVNFMQTEFRRNEASRDSINNTIDVAKAEDVIADIYAELERPASCLKTGMRAFNDIVAGGLRGGRVYSIFGLPGEGKTITLINLAYQLKEYNKNIECRDKTKIPCILFLSMENSAKRIFETLFNVSCTPEPFMNIPQEDAKQMVRTRLQHTEESPIDIVIKYRPNGSIDATDIYKMIDDMNDGGVEVICLIQDYIKRIKPIDRTGEPRIDFGNVVNDFCNIAKFYDIPVLTASQFNREAVKLIDNSRSRNKYDLVSKVGRSMIGESGLIDENLDWTIFITPEYASDGKKYMGFKCTKHRDRIFTSVEQFYQPFEEDNMIKYVCDEGLAKPEFKTSLAPNNNELQMLKTNSIDLGLGSHLDTFRVLSDTTIRSMEKENYIESQDPLESKTLTEDDIIGSTIYTKKEENRVAYLKANGMIEVCRRVKKNQ